VTRVGLLTPIVTAVPGQCSDWESAATPRDLAKIVAAADLLGFSYVTCSQHAVVPIETAAVRGGTYWDPLATLAFLAAHTSRVRLVTNVLVLPYQHPLMLAKQYATLDRLSGGRAVLGVGVGSLQEEFEALGVDYAVRSQTTDDALRTLREALTDGVPGFVLDPAPVQQPPPVWVGGRSLASLRRAVALGNGWMPFGLSLPELVEMLTKATRSDDFEIVLSVSRPLDPLGDPDGTSKALTKHVDAGATMISAALAAASAEHYLDQLDRLARLAAQEGLL
jgi:probable F420-dependent oxidoreductase